MTLCEEILVLTTEVSGDQEYSDPHGPGKGKHMMDLSKHQHAKAAVWHARQAENPEDVNMHDYHTTMGGVHQGMSGDRTDITPVTKERVSWHEPKNIAVSRSTRSGSNPKSVPHGILAAHQFHQGHEAKMTLCDEILNIVEGGDRRVSFDATISPEDNRRRKSTHYTQRRSLKKDSKMRRAIKQGHPQGPMAGVDIHNTRDKEAHQAAIDFHKKAIQEPGLSTRELDVHRGYIVAHHRGTYN